MHIVDVTAIILEDHGRFVPDSIEESIFIALLFRIPISVEGSRSLTRDHLREVAAIRAHKDWETLIRELLSWVVTDDHAIVVGEGQESSVVSHSEEQEIVDFQLIDLRC